MRVCMRVCVCVCVCRFVATLGEVVAQWLENRTHNPKVASSSLGPAGMVGGGVYVQCSLHPQYLN